METVRKTIFLVLLLFLAVLCTAENSRKAAITHEGHGNSDIKPAEAKKPESVKKQTRAEEESAEEDEENGEEGEEDYSDKIEVVMDKNVESDGPGAVIGIVMDGKLYYKAAYGMADIENGVEMTTDRVFDLASCSKQFTATAIMILSEQGKLDLEDDIRKVLPEIPQYNPKRPIRIVDLLHMVSGLAGYQDLIEDYQGIDNEDIVKAVAKAELEYPTGTKYEYSNTAYNLLATIVARVSKMSFGKFMNTAVFQPLGMNCSYVLEGDASSPKRVYGYKKEDGKWILDTEDTPGIVGDGSIFSCMDDMVRYDQALRNRELVSDVTLDLAFTAGKLDSGEPHTYGFGWEIDKHPLYVWHSGSWSGTSTYFGRHRAEDLSVILLMNAYDAGAGDIGGQIEELFVREDEEQGEDESEMDDED